MALLLVSAALGCTSVLYLYLGARGVVLRRPIVVRSFVLACGALLSQLPVWTWSLARLPWEETAFSSLPMEVVAMGLAVMLILLLVSAKLAFSSYVVIGLARESSLADALEGALSKMRMPSRRASNKAWSFRGRTRRNVLKLRTVRSEVSFTEGRWGTAVFDVHGPGVGPVLSELGRETRRYFQSVRVPVSYASMVVCIAIGVIGVGFVLAAASVGSVGR